MRNVIFGWLVVLVVLVPMLAWGDCGCKEPVRPELLPDRPTAAEMGRASAEVAAYAAAMKTYRECLVQRLRTAERDTNTIVSEWNETVERFNAGRAEKK
jgi:hypothetical protein